MAAGVVSAPLRMTDIMDSSLNPTLRRLPGLCRLDRTWVRREGYGSAMPRPGASWIATRNTALWPSGKPLDAAAGFTD